MTTRWSRFFRGWAAAAFATFVAALSHTFAGGGAPGALAIVVSLAFAGIICIGMTGPAQSLWRTSVAVGASQLVFHGLFLLTGASGTAATTLVQRAPDGAHHHAAAVSVVTSAPMAPGSVHGGLGSDGMIAAHAAAAIVTILALRHGESAIQRLLATARLAIRILLPRLAGAIAPSSPRQSVHAAPIAAGSPREALISPMRHRGPPALAGAFRRTAHLLSA
ncbi:hypothetical protein EEJ31_00865 [Cryobacterium tepidiphilum]|uniref:Uncharacterized protein n=2 Tax=Cryobacterium tepidiphilum TaxID=2486026 RepID=A0A3M8LP85_9MICO|nr:hypothetical protein EEJ31_00865 [Cryobacterium tepidiphilum]